MMFMDCTRPVLLGATCRSGAQVPMVSIAVLMCLDVLVQLLYSSNVIQALLTESTCAQAERHQPLSDSSDSRGVCYAHVKVASEGTKDGLVVVRVRAANVLYDDALR
jgi:hypothetical protein